MLRIFRKDLKLFMKDRRAKLLTFLLPIILITLFSFAFGGNRGQNSKPRPLQLAVTDLDKTPASAKNISQLDSIRSIELNPMDLDKAKDQVTRGNVVGVLVFYKGFQDSLEHRKSLPVELMYDKAQEMQVGLLQSVLIGAMVKQNMKERMDRSVEGFVTSNFPNLDKSMQNKIISNVEGKLQQSDPAKASVSPIKMTSIVGERKDRQLFLIQSIAGVAIMMLLFSISGLSTGLLDEKESGTLKRLLYSPLKPTDILFGKMLTAITISIAQLAIMFLYAKMAFGLNISQNIPALVLMIISTAFAVSGIGMFLASISKTRAQAQGLGTLTILTMSALGGSMVPLFVMPAIMQKIALFTVNYWGIQGFYDIFWRGLPTIDILPRVIVLLGIGLVLTLVSVNLFNRNVRQLA